MTARSTTYRNTTYQLSTVGRRTITADRVAATSGPMITVVVGVTCIALGLSVFWKGDASETAAGFWPPAGFALVAFLAVPRKRWGWVCGGVLFPTLTGLAFGLAPTISLLLWAVGNCVEPALAAIVLSRLVKARKPNAIHALLLFLAVAVIAAPMVGGAIGSLGTVLGYDQAWFDVWREWVLGDALGVLVVAPLLLNPSKLITRRRVEVLGFFLVVTTSIGLPR